MATPYRDAMQYLFLLVAACGLTATPTPAQGPEPSASPARSQSPHTRAEATHYTETSHYDDVMAFLDTLQHQGAPITLSTLGTTPEGRAIPLVVASHPRITTAAEAHRLGRPIVYVNANIHAGEVEGKEAVLALLRDLSAAAQSNRPTVLDSLVLIVVPDYNADGNERFAPQAVNRDEQNGPERVGTNVNALGLNLNRDYVKIESPETRGALALFQQWDPDVYVDLHTTDGSYHGYAVTYSPALSPAAPLGDYTRILLAELRTNLRTREQLETFDYGNFDTIDGDRDITDPVKTGWYTYDYRPRFGTNYVGLRNRIAILCEGFSHDPFARRIASMTRFVHGILSLVSEHAREIRTHVVDADHVRLDDIPLSATITSRPRTESVRVERLIRTGDSAMTQPGVPRGVLRTGHIVTQEMPVYDRFDGTNTIARPSGYLVSTADSSVLRRLAEHGITMTVVRSGQSFAAVQSYIVDSVSHAPQPFQKHYEVRLTGHWTAATTVITDDSLMYIPTDQPLGTLAIYLLEPESADSFATWNFFDPELSPGRPYPVRRVSVR